MDSDPIRPPYDCTCVKAKFQPTPCPSSWVGTIARSCATERICMKKTYNPGSRALRFPTPLRTVLTFAAAITLGATAAHAQTTDDGIMLSRFKYCTGVFYTYDTWDHYWEGTNFRSNANIGAITTRNVSYVGNYGLTDHINLLVNVPYIWTSASQGVLHGQRGWQDLTVSVKAKVLSVPVRSIGAVRAIAVVSGSIPMSDYTPTDAPLSIGTQSKQVAGRATLNYLGKNGVYLNAGMAYTFRDVVTINQPEYYTNGQLYLSNQVSMPNTFDYNVGGGYRRNDMTLVVTYSDHQTRGGGDIRPQDMPFLSNRQLYSRIGGTVTIPVPRMHDLQYWAIYNYTLNGRNVGQANTATVGMLYTFNFEKRGTK